MKHRILLVDDDHLFLDGLMRLLHSKRDVWDVNRAHSVDEAIQKISQQIPDVIVTDVMMPLRDGFELLEVIQAGNWTRSIPVIMLTGRHEKALRQRALNAGATDLLCKPVDQEELLARMRNALQMREYQLQIERQNAELENRVALRTVELAESQASTMLRLGRAAEFRDVETGAHVMRVSCCSRILSEALGMDDRTVERIFLGSALHDIGKIAVPDAILRKPGKLTVEERVVMETHSALGYEILTGRSEVIGAALEWGGRPSYMPHNPYLETAAQIALCHQERWSGNGYPQGLVGEEIPIEARITAVADCYDALRSERPYKPAYSEEETLKILRSESERDFDPEVFEAFENHKLAFGLVWEQFRDENESVLERCVAA